MEDFKGKVALVTGGSRGIGSGIALALAKEGADVAVNYRVRETEAMAVCKAILDSGQRGVPCRADLSDAGEVRRMVDEVETALGAVSILVNNAGIALLRSVDEVTERDWDETLAVNLKSAFLLTQAVLPGMRARRWGRILNVSSTAAQVGGVVGVHYAASKAGMIGLTHAYASALAGENIAVNAIAPALIETDMLTGPLAARRDRIPAGRFGTVEEVTDVAMALLRNGYVTGQTVQVNGGVYLT